MNEQLIAAIGSAVGVASLGAGWWFKKWITGVDKKLEVLNEAVQKLVVSNAVVDEKNKNNKEQNAKVEGNLSQLQDCINKNTQDIGRLSSSVEKIWITFEKLPSVKDNRFSDKIKEG